MFRKSASLVSLALLFLAFGQTHENSSILDIKLRSGGDPFWNYYVLGEERKVLLRALLEQEELEQKEKASYLIKNVQLDGFNHKLKMRVLDGVYCREDDGSFGFRCFYSNEIKEEAIACMDENDELGLHIYVNEQRLKNKPAVRTPEQNQVLLTYFDNLIKAHR